MLLGWHHVALIASDLERALDFYGRCLGFEVVARHYRAERQSWKVDLAGPGGVRLELFTFPGAPPRPSRPEALGLRHLAFAVDDVQAVRAGLQRQGVACEAVRTDPYTGRAFFFCADPDGLPLEFYEAGSPE
ncbi:MAG TPA: VOC family protein [Burkholderiaceae bacterium]|nr:VOC family protein [Burkholderiaceae bacterium]